MIHQGWDIRTNRYIWSQTKGENVQMFDYNWWFLDNYYQDINILNLLTTSENYSRYE